MTYDQSHSQSRQPEPAVSGPGVQQSGPASLSRAFLQRKLQRRALQRKVDPQGADPAQGEAATAAAEPLGEEREQLEERGRAALAALPKTSAADASSTPGHVGQGTVGDSQELPDWFREIQSRLVASTTWGEPEENAQHAIRDYALFVARSKSKDGKVPGHIKVFFDYIGRGSKNDDAARKGGFKGTAALTGAKGAKNWCAGAATRAQEIAKKEGRAAVLADLKERGLEPSLLPTLFFDNLAKLSGAKKAQMFYGQNAYATPLEPGDRVDYLFKGCQYGGHAVHVVAEIGGAFLHVSGNTTRHSAVATGQANRLAAKPAGLDLGVATSVASEEARTRATQHIAEVSQKGGFDGGVLVYMIQRQSDPYKALELLETEDEEQRSAAMKKLLLRPIAGGAA